MHHLNQHGKVIRAKLAELPEGHDELVSLSTRIEAKLADLKTKRASKELATIVSGGTGLTPTEIRYAMAERAEETFEMMVDLVSSQCHDEHDRPVVQMYYLLAGQLIATALSGLYLSGNEPYTCLVTIHHQTMDIR
jgi:hypothetical protein